MNFSKSGKENVLIHFLKFNEDTFITGVQLKYITIVGPVYMINNNYYRNMIIPNNFNITEIKSIPEYKNIIDIIKTTTSHRSLCLAIIYHIININNIYYKESKQFTIFNNIKFSTKSVNLIIKLIGIINTINMKAEFIQLSKNDIIYPYQLYNSIWKRLYINKILTFVNKTYDVSYFLLIRSWEFNCNHYIKYQFQNNLNMNIGGGNDTTQYSCLDSLEDGCDYIDKLDNISKLKNSDDFKLSDLSMVFFTKHHKSLLEYFNLSTSIKSLTDIKKIIYDFIKSIELLVMHGIIYNNSNFEDILYTDTTIKLSNFSNSILSNRHIDTKDSDIKNIEQTLSKILNRNIIIKNNDVFIATYCLNDIINFNTQLLKLVNIFNLPKEDTEKCKEFITKINKDSLEYLNKIDDESINQLSFYCKSLLTKYFDNNELIQTLTLDKIKLNYYDKIYENNKTEFLINYIKNM